MTDTVTPTQADIELSSRIVRDFRQNGWPAKENELANLLARRRLAAEATQAAEIERLKQELQLYLPPASISGDYGQGWAEGQAWMINCIRGEDAFDKAVPLTHALVEKDDEIARLREALHDIKDACDAPFADDWVGGESDWIALVKQECRAALSAQPSEHALPSDVVRLVIAARTMAFGDWCCEGEDYKVARKELDDAAEAFASRVEWPDTPIEQDGGE